MGIFEERIKLYDRFLKEKKVFPDTHKRVIDNCKKIIDLLKGKKMTPLLFSKFDSRDRWDIASELKNVVWCCDNCKQEITTLRPDRASEGVEICCSNCDNELTRRTAGGQSDPFNYTFKRK